MIKNYKNTLYQDHKYRYFIFYPSNLKLQKHLSLNLFLLKNYAFLDGDDQNHISKVDVYLVYIKKEY